MTKKQGLARAAFAVGTAAAAILVLASCGSDSGEDSITDAGVNEQKRVQLGNGLTAYEGEFEGKPVPCVSESPGNYSCGPEFGAPGYSGAPGELTFESSSNNARTINLITARDPARFAIVELKSGKTQRVALKPVPAGGPFTEVSVYGVIVTGAFDFARSAVSYDAAGEILFEAPPRRPGGPSGTVRATG